MNIEDTIFALASGKGRAGISVIRLSGLAAGAALRSLCSDDLPTPRQAKWTNLVNAQGDILDDGIVLWFPSPASFTGEDVVELHVHGGNAVINATLEALSVMPGLRQAEPGEFSRRAFENGKMDLTAAEGLADLIEAETEAQRKQAQRQSRGELGRLYDGWRENLIRAQALSEANIDFSDEDIPDDLTDEAIYIASQTLEEIAKHLNDAHRGERLRAGLSLAIIGPPNAGKSCLLNRLAKRDVAIVSDIAGTTRDIIDVQLDLGGFPVVAADTAGLREAGDKIETEGIRRTRERAEDADMKLVVFDAGDVQAAAELDSLTLELIDSNTLVIFNKCDEPHSILPDQVKNHPVLVLSAKTGEGFDSLLLAMQDLASKLLAGDSGPSLTRYRHRDALKDCQYSLERAILVGEAELMGEDLRLAVRSLGRITGRVDVEDIFDVIFSKFCIGK